MQLVFKVVFMSLSQHFSWKGKYSLFSKAKKIQIQTEKSGQIEQIELNVAKSSGKEMYYEWFILSLGNFSGS